MCSRLLSGVAISGSSEAPRELPARRGFSVFYLGKTLLSRVDPVTQAEHLAGEIRVKERTLYFCPSPLYGYGLDIFLKKLGNNSALLCAEADDRLFELSVKNMGGLLGGETEKDESFRRICLVKASGGPEGGAALCAYVRKPWGERRFRRVEILRLTGGWQLFPELYDGLAGYLHQDMATSWSNAMTLVRLGRLYARNAVRNLAFIPGSGDIRAINFGAAPVLVLGAGPSLDGVLDGLEGFFGIHVREPAGRGFRIVCADTCIPCLKDRGIRPDLVVILESQHWNLGDFTGARGWEIPAALDLSAQPASARVLGGKVFLFMTPWTELRLFRRLEAQNLLPSGLTPLGSVGLAAAELARRLGSGPVVTAGMDFCFTLDSYHARSTPGHRARLASCSRLNSLMGASAFRAGTFAAVSKTGLPVRSDPAMRNYRDLFEQEFGADPRMYDIAGPGLSLGVKTLSPCEAFGILAGNEAGKPDETPQSGRPADPRQALAAFAEEEAKIIRSLRGCLTGETAPARETLEKLLDYCDYLWAHFPECAGAGGRRPGPEDISFLKRVRTEIDPFLKLWEMTLRELTNGE